MATSYIDVIDRAQYRITDYDVLKRAFQDHYSLMERYLMSAVSDFRPHCIYNLSDRNEDEKAFNADLDDECLEILALGISYYWLSSRTLSSELTANRMSAKEYSFFSPANLLGQVKELRNDVQQEFNRALVLYTYRHGNISNPATPTTRIVVETQATQTPEVPGASEPEPEAPDSSGSTTEIPGGSGTNGSTDADNPTEGV